MTTELNPGMTFESFAVGPGNQLAVTAARAVAERLDGAYSPLYIHGGGGLGKTHLLIAIGHVAAEAFPPRVVEYFTPSRLAEAFNAAASAGQSETFRNLLADVDVLLIDDAHLFERRQGANTELQRLTQDILVEGRNLVLAGHVPPGEIDGLRRELVTALSQGLVVEIEPLDYETRLAILQRRAESRASGLDQTVLAAVAEFNITTARELIALLNRLIALDAVSETRLMPDAARALLEGEALALDGRRPVPSVGGAETQRDEFADFLSEVSVAVQQQIEGWETDVRDAIERWGREGFDTKRLEGLLTQSNPMPVEATIVEFERDVQQLRTLRESVAATDPTQADDPVFCDPDRVSEAHILAESIVPAVELPPGPSSAWTFDSYIETEGNRAANQAVHEVVDSPVSAHNPLVIVGATGVGKTHLLHALGSGLSEHLAMPVACLSGQEFHTLARSAVEENALEAFGSLFDRAGALLIDDIHMLVGHERSQEELYRIVSVLIGTSRQVAFTVSSDPAEIDGLTAQLRQCIDGGRQVVLTSPDRELRRRLVQRVLRDRVGEADPELLDYLADRPAESVRVVTGLAQRIVDSADGQGLPPSAALARQLIEGALPKVERVSRGMRTSGVMVSLASGVKSREKMIWNWPDPGERLIEELS